MARGPEDSYRAVHGRKGLVELGHAPAQRRRTFSTRVTRYARVGKVECRLDAGDPSADDQSSLTPSSAPEAWVVLSRFSSSHHSPSSAENQPVSKSPVMLLQSPTQSKCTRKSTGRSRLVLSLFSSIAVLLFESSPSRRRTRRRFRASVPGGTEASTASAHFASCGYDLRDAAAKNPQHDDVLHDRSPELPPPSASTVRRRRADPLLGVDRGPGSARKPGSRRRLQLVGGISRSPLGGHNDEHVRTPDVWIQALRCPTPPASC